MSLHPGEIFAGYTVERRLGVGGMGEVYLARHPRLPRYDAVKILPAHLATDDDFRARFIREADVAARLEHPNIVAVRDRGDDAGRLWIAMEYVDGDDADALLRTSPEGLPPGRVAGIIADAARGLDHAHSLGVLHRDVKPANLLLTTPAATREPTTKLSDFGIARVYDDATDLTRTGTTMGSYAYASPEQLKGEPLDPRADVYSLAATAYTLLTGRRAFDASNPAVIIASVLDATPPPASARRPGLPPGVDAVLARGLAKDRAHRAPSCGAFAAELADALAGRPAGPGPTAWPSGPLGPTAQQPLPPYRTTAIGPTSPPTHPTADDAATPPPGPVPPARRRSALPTAVAAAVVAVALLAAAIFVVTRSDDSTPAAETTTPSTGITAASTPNPTATSPGTAVPPSSAAPSPTTSTLGPAPRNPADLGLSTPITTPTCDGTAIVVVGNSTAGDRAQDAAAIRGFLAEYPSARYLSGMYACPSIRVRGDDGNLVYAAYVVVGNGSAAMCQALRSGRYGDHYAKLLTNDTGSYPPERFFTASDC